MNDRSETEAFWAEVSRQVGGACVTYTPEELAQFSEGRMRPAHARRLESHLQVCEACKDTVENLRQELSATQVVYRVAPARPGWQWKVALAPVALAAAALVVVLATNRPGTQAPVPTAPRPSAVIAEKPKQPPATPATGPEQPAPPPEEPAAAPEATRPSQPARERVQPEQRRRWRPRPVPEQIAPAEESSETPAMPYPGMITSDQAVAHAPSAINAMPVVATLAEGDLEALLESPPAPDPATHMDLINDLGVDSRKLGPREPPIEALLASPDNELEATHPSDVHGGDLLQ